MPFKSEKQRKWMWANDPEMAKKWEKEEKMKKETKVRQLIKKMVRETMDEDFAGSYPAHVRKQFDGKRRKQSEVLGYKLTGKNDIKTEIDDATVHENPKPIKETSKRDYKDEYKKFQSSDKSKKYRAELNKYNRDKGTYGNGDGKDASHKGGKIVGFEKESVNRGRAEKSRLKKEQKLIEAKFKDIDVKNMGKKKLNDLMIYLLNILDLGFVSDIKTDTKKRVLSVNVSKINPKSIENVKKRFGVDLTEGKLKEGKFSKEQLNLLKLGYGSLNKLDPSSPTYKKFIKFLEKLPKDELKQLANADIKFVSMLAKNRIKEEKLTEVNKSLPPFEIAKRMMKSKYWNKAGKGFSEKVIKKFRGRGVTPKSLDKWLPDYIEGKEISKLFEGKLTEAKESIFDVAAKVMKDQQNYNYKSKKGMVKLDMQTANLLTQVFKKVNPKMKKYLSKMGEDDPARMVQTLRAVAK